MDMILQAKDVKKSFKNNDVLKGISFEIKKNSVVGFIGNNGAGKTTTMKIILGLMKQDSGSVNVLGEKVLYGNTATNRHIGYLPDVPAFYPYLSPLEYLKFCAEITSVDKKHINERVKELIKFVGIEKSAKRKIGGFSRGMIQRLGIAQALINKPELLICDEPTSALDPIGRAEVLDLLHNIKGETTVFFSTHILSDIERICDHVIMLEKGKIVLNGSIDSLKRNNQSNDIKVVFKNLQDKEKALHIFYDYSNLKCENKERFELIIHSENFVEKTEEIVLNVLHSNKIFPKLFEIVEPTLEDLFVSLNK